ncbi:helix-turn-helix domain-containing protein [Yinghuangia seranimata]|uniref:helix-turn-helix domain-containing protein n=1 Tax=Yinghuangia seranimata TaxID=408067 RepID=UPI00248C1883|nr:helix-turn-helix transcriptional regulator [Yinghuangia seranimata]MDI2125096.1 helix-turn-helix transcriptional regulator [Yinghuangia seranimata]
MADPDDEDAGDGAVDLFRALGRMVKVLRERAGLTQRQLGERLGYSEEQISSLERGRRVPQDEFLDAVDGLLGANGMLSAAKEDVARAKAKARVRHPAWFRDYARLEREAVELNYYGALALPGVLQTEGHARAVFTSRQPLLDEETVEMRVAARLARQQVLTRWPPPQTTFTIEESALQRPIGGKETHRGQLERLLQIGRLRNVELQVMPTDRDEHPSLGGPFTLLTPKGRPQVAYVEVQNISRLITEPEEVRILAARYGSIRAQALTPQESASFIANMLGDR